MKKKSVEYLSWVQVLEFPVEGGWLTSRWSPSRTLVVRGGQQYIVRSLLQRLSPRDVAVTDIRAVSRWTRFAGRLIDAGAVDCYDSAGQHAHVPLRSIPTPVVLGTLNPLGSFPSSYLLVVPGSVLVFRLGVTRRVFCPCPTTLSLVVHGFLVRS